MEHVTGIQKYFDVNDQFQRKYVQLCEDRKLVLMSAKPLSFLLLEVFTSYVLHSL